MGIWLFIQLMRAVAKIVAKSYKASKAVPNGKVATEVAKGVTAPKGWVTQASKKVVVRFSKIQVTLIILLDKCQGIQIVQMCYNKILM